jgi:hypothetical protein
MDQSPNPHNLGDYISQIAFGQITFFSFKECSENDPPTEPAAQLRMHGGILIRAVPSRIGGSKVRKVNSSTVPPLPLVEPCRGPPLLVFLAEASVGAALKDQLGLEGSKKVKG